MKKHPKFRFCQFNEGMDCAVIKGNLEVVQLLGARFPAWKVTFKVINNAVINDRGDILHWMMANVIGRDSRGYAVPAALERGNVSLAKLLRPYARWGTELCVRAAVESGKVDAVKWAYSLPGRTENLTGTIDTAVTGGHIEILEWLLERIDSDIDLSVPELGGRFDVVEYCLTRHRSRCVSSTTTMNRAARFGRLDMVRLLHESGQGCTSEAMDHAATNGHLGVVQWLHHNRVEGCTTNAMDFASGQGHSEVVKWLHANRAEGCTSNAMDRAAANGHLKVVKWLHANRVEGCTTDAVDCAAKNGHLDVFKWLLQNRPEGGTTNAITLAASEGRFSMVRGWLNIRS